MRHDWIFDVLTDLRSYAEQNNLQALAVQVEATILLARAEIAMEQGHTSSAAPDDDTPTKPRAGRRAH